MASSALQAIGFILGVISWAGMIATCASPEWRKNSHGQTLIDKTLRYDGLWVRCRLFASGQTTCNGYNSFFIGLPDVLQVCRALMITALVLGFVAIIITIVGMKCTNISPSNQKAKAIVSMIGGLLFGIAGILLSATLRQAYKWMQMDGFSPMTSYYIVIATTAVTFISSVFIIVGSAFFRDDEDDVSNGVQCGIAVSFFSDCVTQRCFDHLQITGIDYKIQFVLGPAIYGGWACMILAVVSGLLLTRCCGLSRNSNLELESRDVVNSPQKIKDIGPEETSGVYRPNTSFQSSDEISKPPSIRTMSAIHESERKKITGTISSLDSGRSTSSYRSINIPFNHEHVGEYKHIKNANTHYGKRWSQKYKNRHLSKNWDTNSKNFDANCGTEESQNKFYRDTDDCMSHISAISLITTYL